MTAEASLDDVLALGHLQRLLTAGPYLPWTSGAMRPAGLRRVLDLIVLDERDTIVECGSGLSTVLLARLLAERGEGRLVSIEHDAAWAARTRRALRRERLDDVVIVHAPLDAGGWYDDTALQDALPPSIDLLLVDGPPAHDPRRALARAPALPRLAPRLAEEAIVVLDDADRDGERRVIAEWEQASAWRFVIDVSAGIALGARGEAPSLH